MPSFTIKGIPRDLLSRLKRRAAEQRRSINQEVLVCLEQALRTSPVDPAAVLSHADAVRERVTGPRWTAAAIRAARSTGRP